MQTRREQVQAYRFVTRRIVSALLSGEPETNNLPMRRLGMAIFGSVMVGAVVLAGAGVYGLVTKNRAPLAAQTLIIERETGAKYVYLDERLYPVLNYTSARLILNTADPDTRTMSQASLKGYPRGLPLGIPNAPDALPEPSALLGHPWRICNTAGAVKSREPTTRVVIGRDLPGAVTMGARSLLVSFDNRTMYLLWNDTRMRIASPTTMAGLGLSSAQAIPVGQQLINAVKAGPDLRIISVPGAGERSSRDLGDQTAHVGDVFRVSGQHYVLTRNGLATVGEMTARLRVAAGSSLRDITAQVAARNLSREELEPAGFPQQMPTLHPAMTAESTVCVVYRGDTPTASIELREQAPAEFAASVGDGVEARQNGQDAVQAVDRVVIEGGRGTLVQASSATGDAVPGATIYLITDRGIRYPLGSAEARIALGYGAVRPTSVPASLLALIPIGPTLSTDSATRFVEPDPGATFQE